MKTTSRIIPLLLAAIMMPSGIHAARWSGSLALKADTPVADTGGTLTVTLASSDARNKDAAKDRDAVFRILPARFNLFSDAETELKAQRAGPTTFKLTLPRVSAGWYVITAVVRDDEGRLDYAASLTDKNRRSFAAWVPVAIRDPRAPFHVRIHTERARCVFCPGEEIRIFVSARGKTGVKGELLLSLERDLPQADAAYPSLQLAKGALNAPAGKTQTLAFDLPATRTRAFAPGDYHLVARVGGKPVDRYAVRLVTPERAGGKARWWHGMPYGNSPGFDASPVLPTVLNKKAGWVKGQARKIHNANLWVNIFAAGLPLMQPSLKLPAAEDPALPPPEACQRPSTTHALYQRMMAEGVGLAVMLGGGELGSENYMPLPTIIPEHIRIQARSYLNGALSLQHFPHFVGVYCDAYGRPDWHGSGGKGEVSGAQVEQVRKAMYEAACKAAGCKTTPQAPFRFGDRRTPMKAHGKEVEAKTTKDQRKKFEELLKEKHGYTKGEGKKARRYLDGNAISKLTAEEKLALWNGTWKAAGVPDVPKPPVSYPFPRPKRIEFKDAPEDAYYRYTDFVQRGMERFYKRATTYLEGEMPGVFTILNKNRENHRQPFVYAWGDWSRSPSVAAEFTRGVTVAAVSEWNLDAEPQPYLLAAWTHRTLLEEGRPVWRTASFRFNGSQSRFLRDAVYLSGRQVTPFYMDPRNATWSFKGSDQSSYAAKDRLKTVTEFLTTFEDLFDRLQPVREVGFFLRPGWGDENSLSMVTGLPAALMTGHQCHVVSHADLPKGILKKYKILFAPGLTEPPRYAFIRKAFKDFVASGGTIVGAPSGSHRYRHLVDLSKFGIREEEQVEKNRDGTPKIDKRTGKPRVRKVWVETLAQRAAATKAAVWKDFPKTEVLPVDFCQRWAYIDENGEKQRSGRHWTGSHEWGNVCAPALENHKPLKAAFDKHNDPLVKSDQPEVFVCAAKPLDPKARGIYLFASNFTVPKGKKWTDPRVPWFFYPTYAAPVVATLKVKEAGIGAIYDLVTGNQVETKKEGDRLVFTCNLTAMEGRVFALLPDSVGGAELKAPAQVAAGSIMQPSFTLMGANGQPLSTLGSVHLRLLDAKGRELAELFRATGTDGKLPALRVPTGVPGPLRLEVKDCVASWKATATIKVAGETATPVSASGPVTVHRGEAIHDYLKSRKDEVRVLADSGRIVWKKVDDPADAKRIDEMRKKWRDEQKKKEAEAKKKKKKFRRAREPKWPKPKKMNVREIAEPNPELASELARAKEIAAALKAAGIKAAAVESKDVITGPLYAHPWTGGGGGYRSRHCIPNRRIEGPVVLVGSPESSALVKDLERASVVGRSLGPDNTAHGRAVIAWLPRAFSPEAHAVVMSARGANGWKAAIEKLKGLLAKRPNPDAFNAAREDVRLGWVPADVKRFKKSIGVLPKRSIEAVANDASAKGAHAPGVTFEERLGPHIFDLDASPGGVAVSLSTLARPVALISPDGKLVRLVGGGENVWARDVKVSADGQTLAAGFALSGMTCAFNATGEKLWELQSGMVHSTNPFGWETRKDCERYLGISPDHKTLIVAAGTKGFQGRDAATGKVLWTVPVDTAASRPRGPASEQIAWSPDGKYALIYPQRKTGQREKKDRRGNVVKDENGKVVMEDTFEKTTFMVDVLTGKPVWKNTSNASGWELYSAIGPKGAWTITCSRGSQFAIRDEKGEVLRIVKPEQLPAQAGASRGMIAPLFLTGTPADKMVLAKPETRGLYLMAVQISDAATKERARKAVAENKENARKLEAFCKDRRSYKKYSRKYVDAFMKTIVGPAAAKRVIADRLSKFPGEFRAGRKRDYRFVQNGFAQFKRMQFEEDRKVIEAACGLKVLREILLPDIICDAVAAPDLSVAYVGLWDHTVRAFDMASGKQLWVRAVNGGCQLALERQALYAGGSRADLYKLDAKTGKVIWQKNLAVACSQTE